MKILNNVSLKPYTTVKIGGVARNLFIPENSKELHELLMELKENYYILGNGSNLLINDNKFFENVIYMKDFDNSIEMISSGKYYVGASVALQNLINNINNDGYGGIEYLYSVPGFLGGTVVMNAGRGKPYNMNIDDFVVNVHVVDSNGYRILNKSECEFGYRTSFFKHKKIIVVGVTFQFDPIQPEESSRLKKERLEFVKNTQDRSKGNFGSVFSENDWKIMKIVKLIHPGFKNGVKFSSKTANWIINEGNGTFNQAIKLINKVKKAHRIIGKNAKTEVIIWE